MEFLRNVVFNIDNVNNINNVIEKQVARAGNNISSSYDLRYKNYSVIIIA